MKKLVALLIAFAAGCANDSDLESSREVGRITPAQPPTFLNAEFASLFGKATFSAHADVQNGMRAMTGELSGRDGNLFFISDEQRGKRGFGGGLSALWDTTAQTGYLLNEPLQAYAPMKDALTNAPLEASIVGEEDLNGERCRKTIISRKVGNDVIPALIVWRGLAQQELPLRIQTTNAPATLTVTLSRIRFQAPPADLFALPNGFKKYDSTDAMLGELMRRRTEAMGARARSRRDRYGAPMPEDEENERGMQNPTRPY